jgi:hypothetical protein
MSNRPQEHVTTPHESQSIAEAHAPHEKPKPAAEVVDRHPEVHRRESVIVKFDDEVSFQNGVATVKDAEHPLDDTLRHMQLHDKATPRTRRHELKD